MGAKVRCTEYTGKGTECQKRRTETTCSATSLLEYHSTNSHRALNTCTQDTGDASHVMSNTGVKTHRTILHTIDPASTKAGRTEGHDVREWARNRRAEAQNPYNNLSGITACLAPSTLNANGMSSDSHIARGRGRDSLEDQ